MLGAIQLSLDPDDRGDHEKSQTNWGKDPEAPGVRPGVSVQSDWRLAPTRPKLRNDCDGQAYQYLKYGRGNG
jgi:hypothetical protein